VWSWDSWHAPAKFPGAPGKIARPLVLNAVAGQLDNNCHEKQELEAAEDEEPVAGVRADRLVVDLLQGLARVLLTFHVLRVRDDVVVLEEEVLERFDVVAVATPGIVRQEELGALLRPGHYRLEGLQVKFGELVGAQVEVPAFVIKYVIISSSSPGAMFHQPGGLEPLQGVEQVVGEVDFTNLLVNRVLVAQCFQ